MEISESARQRFWSKVEKESPAGCWLWSAGKDVEGYGRVMLNRREMRAHRAAYELLVGPIPEGLQLDHLCRVTSCVNPAHLEPVTSRENTRRGDTPSRRNAEKTHCPRGHPYDAVNSQGRRICRTCSRETFRRWWKRQDQEYRRSRMRVI